MRKILWRNKMKVYDSVQRVLVSKEELQKRIAEIGSEISREYEGKQLLMVCILRGSAIFFADLVRAIDIPVRMDFMAISSYGSGARSSGEVRMVKDLNTKIEDLHVIIVEDIIDSGYTIKYLKNLLLQRNPASLKVCTLLDKPERREVDIEGDYVGFKIPNEFVIGYGLDYAEDYRNIPEVCVIAPSAIK